MLSSFTPLSVRLSSVQLFNCIIKPFSYSSHSVSLPPLCTRSVPSYSFKSMKLHRPFLSPWLDEYCSRPSSEYFSFLLCLLPLAFTLSILSSSSPCHSFSSCLSVIPVGHLVCFHKTFSVLGLLAFKMSDESQRAVFFFFL